MLATLAQINRKRRLWWLAGLASLAFTLFVLPSVSAPALASGGHTFPLCGPQNLSWLYFDNSNDDWYQCQFFGQGFYTWQLYVPSDVLPPEKMIEIDAPTPSFPEELDHWTCDAYFKIDVSMQVIAQLVKVYTGDGHSVDIEIPAGTLGEVFSDVVEYAYPMSPGTAWDAYAEIVSGPATGAASDNVEVVHG